MLPSRSSEQLLIWATPEIANTLNNMLAGAVQISSIAEINFKLPTILIGDLPQLFDQAIQRVIRSGSLLIIFVLHDNSGQLPQKSAGFPIFGFLTQPLYPLVVKNLIATAREHHRLSAKNCALEQEIEETFFELEKAFIEIDELNKIGAALSAERDTNKLLEMILQKIREITNSDAGALYLVEEDEQSKTRMLRFTLTQNDSVNVPFNSFVIPIDKSRVASYVALTGNLVHIEDAYHLPPDVDYSFSKDFDLKIGYRTKSILAVPMQNHKGEVIGVLQLLNHKPNRNEKVTPENADQILRPYPECAQHLARSLASQAAMALENNRMIADIQKLFEGFVKASVMAIESRDPTTSGHSFRVSKLTVALAEAVDRINHGPYADIKFSRDQIQEISYASVLHDFGKVGVREHVLVKANKLYPDQLDIVRQRFNYVRKTIQEQNTRQRLEYLLAYGRDAYLAKLADFDQELAIRLQEIDNFLQIVLDSNLPSVLPSGNFLQLKNIAAYNYLTWDGHIAPLLTDDEARLLSILKGSLDENERREIESHVLHTFKFLSQIPWTRELHAIPEIARAHHEKLDGSGYPFHLAAADIPIQSKMMAIADIFDALSASDRPYKPALPANKSLEIIHSEVKRNLLDA